MSRNLARTNCRTCESAVRLCGVPYRSSGVYSGGMWIADAECEVCGTKYTAWIGPRDDDLYGSRDVDRRNVRDFGFYDLSYRSTFNDEPGPEDLPKDKVEVFRVVKVGERQVWTRTDI